MTFKTDMIALLNPAVGNNFFLVTAPDGFRSSDAFAVMTVIGGDDRFYVDQSLPDLEHRRVQINVWGNELPEVEAATNLIRATLAASINDPLTRFVGVEPLGQASDEYNDVLKLFGSRQDFGIHWRNPAIV